MNNSINYPIPPTPSNYSGVTINITSPTVNANTGSCGCTAPLYADTQSTNRNNAYPYSSLENTGMIQTTPALASQSAQAYPPQYYMNNYNYANPQLQNSDYSQKAQKPVEISNSMQTGGVEDDNNATSQEIIENLNQMAEEKRNLEKNGKEKKIVALTNEYIMSLENYLNNPNSEIRLLAAEEVLTRLNEDSSRYDDLALNALVNKMLQDPEKIIRTAAMSALSSNLASGNELTVKLLENIQKNPNSDKTDVVEAANILLKNTTQTETKYVPQPITTEQSQIETNQLQHAEVSPKTNISVEDKIDALNGGITQ